MSAGTGGVLNRWRPVALAGALLLLLAVAALRGLVPDRETASGGRESQVPEPRATAAAVDSSDDPRGGSLLEALMSMDEPARNTVLRLAIRDAGFPCDMPQVPWGRAIPSADGA